MVLFKTETSCHHTFLKLKVPNWSKSVINLHLPLIFPKGFEFVYSRDHWEKTHTKTTERELEGGKGEKKLRLETGERYVTTVTKNEPQMWLSPPQDSKPRRGTPQPALVTSCRSQLRQCLSEPSTNSLCKQQPYPIPTLPIHSPCFCFFP